jgi:hypothetical protein
MARIRTIKPQFFRHEGLFDLEQETGLPVRLAFAGLWTAADRDGRFKWAPRELKLDCLPFDECDFSRVLHALATRGHVVKYALDGREYGFIPSWKAHQIINNRESDSTLPDPDDCSIESITCTREPRVIHACGTPLVHASVEGKGKEGKGRGTGREDASRKRDSSPSKPESVSDQVWTDWLLLRKAKKAPVTQTVVDMAELESSKARLSLDAFLSIWCSRGSQGLQADWIKPDEKARYSPNPINTQDRNAEARRLLGFSEQDVINA